MKKSVYLCLIFFCLPLSAQVLGPYEIKLFVGPNRASRAQQFEYPITDSTRGEWETPLQVNTILPCSEMINFCLDLIRNPGCLKMHVRIIAKFNSGFSLGNGKLRSGVITDLLKSSCLR